ncbi:hypothetical protein PPL_10411 [Heterostelium album PN500]|uniref:Uncharacterized protein n=1 Tax=Heterostelium pallidum (strain ATCC 26659 / Pp 5 / PN500) TaxID=670386 RepID=D3BR08_HETP5|nr:hypothetical protein PPL_10411 [Heterostelium album PN500]EFA76194.1 hypothetical protein PPL_10411 [Heterostelium album PN500]|eukprot:XP_020428327.1 hypothetical protein PPL_10411 [Heterostelium album PN500]
MQASSETVEELFSDFKGSAMAMLVPPLAVVASELMMASLLSGSRLSEYLKTVDLWLFDMIIKFLWPGIFMSVANSPLAIPLIGTPPTSNNNLVYCVPNTCALMVTNYKVLYSTATRIPDNLDRICWSLVCKRWFDNRDKYLLFNTDEISLMSNYNNYNSAAPFHLQSYKSIYLKSIDKKRDCIFNIGLGYPYCPKYDYSIEYRAFKKIDSIPSNVTTVILDDNFLSNSRHNLIDSEHLSKLLSQSPNVKELQNCKTLKYKLPEEIQTLSIHSRSFEELTANNIPRGIKNITLKVNHFKQQIGRGVLPEGLESICFGSEYRIKIEPDVLPSSLKHLYLESDLTKLKKQSLPANLEVLQLPKENSINKLLLPNTLHTILEISSCYIPTLMKFPHLTTLSFYDSSSSLDINELPPNLTNLSFSGDYQLKCAIPPTITHLDIKNCRFESSEILPKTSNYRFEILISPKCPELQMTNVHISKLALNSLIDITPGMITPGIESLDLSMTTSKIYVGSIPESVKHLSLNMTTENYHNVIPETVETLELHRTDSLTANSIPKTLKTLIIPFSKSTLQFIPRPLPPNIIFCETNLQHASHIRKLDHQYYLLFGKPIEEVDGEITSEQPAFHFTTAIFHESEFIDLLSRESKKPNPFNYFNLNQFFINK